LAKCDLEATEDSNPADEDFSITGLRFGISATYDMTWNSNATANAMIRILYIERTIGYPGRLVCLLPRPFVEQQTVQDYDYEIKSGYPKIKRRKQRKEAKAKAAARPINLNIIHPHTSWSS
jgi:hypothetical protein